MTVEAARLVEVRTEIVGRAMSRFRLGFVQLGYCYEPIRTELLSALGGAVCSVNELVDGKYGPEDCPLVLVGDLDSTLNSEHGPTLGALRVEVGRRMDAQQALCLVSRSPRCAYAAVPGSSILEDCALISLPLIDADELHAVGISQLSGGAWRLPCMLLPHPSDVGERVRAMLGELGPGILAGLDHALFEVDPHSSSGLAFLGARELEGLRCAGLVVLDDDSDWQLTMPEHARLLRDVLGQIISETVAPPTELATVIDGLWFIERTIRLEVRRVALEKWGTNWRQHVVGGLSETVVKRAQTDGFINSTRIGEIRDPLEWLMMNELIDMVRSDKYGGLGKSQALWRKMQEQLIPVRNRIAHVRMLKSADDEIVATWASAVRTWLKT